MTPSTDISKTSLSAIKDNTLCRKNELLDGVYAAIDIEYYQNTDNTNKRYTIFAVSIVDSLGNVKSKHISDFAAYPIPEKALVQWTMHEILNYRLTIGWYTKGVETRDG